MNTIQYKRLLICLFSFIQVITVCADENPFKMVYCAAAETVINTTYNTTDTIDISNINEGINGLSLDCEILRLSKNGFVRILLEDTSGKDFIVLESNKFRNNNDSITYEDYCEETSSLSNIHPQLLKIYIKDAIVTLNKIKYSTTSNSSSLEYTSELLNADSIRKKQVSQIVKDINNYNRENNKLWTAGVTSVSLMDYETKKRVLGISNDNYDTGGFEYYVGGLFEIGEPDSISTETNDSIEFANSSYVDSFDWRNRHGKNWMTSCKDQGNSGYCVAFAIAGALEAVANLYYNKKIDLDLSEQDIIFEVARNDGDSSVEYIYENGTNTFSALRNVKTCGVLDEASVPFIDDSLVQVPTERADGIECLSFNGFDKVFWHQRFTDRIKSQLINYGPLVSGFSADSMHHAMTLVGYHKINIGDTINHITTKFNGDGIIKEGDYRIGKTYWVFKNSYGEDDRRNGYIYILFNEYSSMNTPYYIYRPLTSKLYSDSDIVCSDNDGDGYYFWGLGNRPSNLPEWVPKQSDGDDSNAQYGPMDSYGHLMSLNPDDKDTIFITEPTDWNSENYIWQHIVVKSGAVLNVSSKVKFYKGVNILIENDGELNVDGGELENVNIEVSSGGSLQVKNKGVIKKYKYFHAADGATIKMANGVIK